MTAPISVEALKAAAAPVFANTPLVIAAWLFGSYATPRERPDSDIDIAILAARSPTLEEYANLRLALTSTINTEAIDLVVLNDASCGLQHEAIGGTLLYCADSARMAGFVSWVVRMFEDEEVLLGRSLAILREGKGDG